VQRLELPAELDVTAEGFVAAARACGFDDELVFGAGAVRRVDATGIQLLYAIVVAARARGSRVSWDSPSRVLTEALHASGLAPSVHLDGHDTTKG
jgi:anti-anti-sigma regulatory factor